MKVKKEAKRLSVQPNSYIFLLNKSSIFSVCAGAAHALASTALLVRQQSLDEPSQERSFDGASARRSRVIRQGSVEGYEKKKKSDEGDHRKKIKNNMISHLGALIAVEANDPNALRVVLTKNAFDVDSKLNNCLYGDYKIKWTLLDVALMLGYHECAQMLIDHGAQENILMNSITKRHDSLREATETTKNKMNNLKQAGASKENEKQLKQLTAHCELLHNMSNHVTRNLKPEPPEDVRAVVTGATEVTVYFNPPSTSNSTVVKYKVEWCKSPDFDDHIDSWEETNMVKLPVRIGNLEKGIRLSFRVSSANIFDYSDTVAASPRQVQLSSWEDVDGRRDGRHEHMASISGISDQIDKHRSSLVWQRVFPTNEINLKKRKTGLKELFSASSKFSKNLQRGCYLATIIYTEGKVACTVDDCLPIIEVDEALTTVNRDDFHWLMKLSVCWDQLSVLLDYNPNAYSNTNSLSFRSKIIAAAQSMHSALGLKDIGRLYQQPIIHENIIFLVTVRFVPDTSYLQALTLRWMSFDKLLRKKTSCPALDALNRNIVTVMNFFEACQISLKRGLYLCYLKLQSSINCARVVVPDSLPTVLPFVQVRDNPHVTEEEWAWIKAIDQNETIRPTESQKAMHSQLCSAATALLQDLDVDPDLVPGHRLYRTEILQPHPDVSIILILPKPEEVCAAPTGSSGHGEFVESRRGCYSLPIPIFEMAHLWTYHPDFITLYCRLSLFVEYFIMISQHEQRKSMLEHDVKVYQKQHEVLSNFQKQLEDVWKNARWISRIASIARDKNCTQVAVPLCRLMAPLQSGSNEDVTDVGYHSDQSGDKQECDRPVARVRPQSHAGSPRSSNRTFDFEQLQITRRRAATVQSSPSNGITTTPRSLPQSPLLGSKDSEFRKEILLQNGVVKIYAAYDCGLPDGSSVRLSISQNTTSQEVVVYVVEQFAKATARIKKKDVEIPDAEEFCLASVVGPKEKMFKDDFPILRLQAPWNRGKLFVRRRDTILAAIYHGNESYV